MYIRISTQVMVNCPDNDFNSIYPCFTLGGWGMIKNKVKTAICDMCGENSVVIECKNCDEHLCSFCVFKKKTVCEFYGSCKECDWVLNENL